SDPTSSSLNLATAAIESIGGPARSRNLSESASQGIKTIYAPASNVGKLKQAAKGIKIIPVKSVSQVMKKLFP
ncbi:MAG: hypothetical protein V3S48_03480, partial [Candidatus Neomarinimicrobiota bacterium]